MIRTLWIGGSRNGLSISMIGVPHRPQSYAMVSWVTRETLPDNREILYAYDPNSKCRFRLGYQPS